MIEYVILLSRQGKIRLVKWYKTYTTKEKQNIIREISTTVPLRKSKMCNVIESEEVGSRIVYKRYASLYFIVGIDNDENELLTLNFIQRYVETMDKAYGNVCELDIVFNYQLAYTVIDEMVISGAVVETSISDILGRIKAMDEIEVAEHLNTSVGAQ